MRDHDPTGFLGNEKHLALLKECLRRRSARPWNRWRAEHPEAVPDLRGLKLEGATIGGLNLRRARLDGAELVRVSLAGGHLEQASLERAELRMADLASAHAERVRLSDANLRYARLDGGDFRHAVASEDTGFNRASLREADFSGAKMPGVDFTQANLSGTLFDGANLARANFSNALLDGTSFLGANLTEAGIWDAVIRQVKTDAKTRQKALGVDVHVVWERRRRGEVIEFTEADNLHVAQFHSIVEEHGSIGDLLSATSKRVVLILGRFLPKRKRLLDKLADALRERGKIPVIFDFPNAADRELSDTVRFIACMSQFIVVDMTKASSVPLELQATIPDLVIPVIPIVESGQEIFAMFSDLQRRYFWVQQPTSYRNADELVKHVDDAILYRANQAAEEIRARRETSAAPPVSVARIGKVRRRRR